MDRAEITVYYLEMRAPPAGAVVTRRDDVDVLHARHPPVAYYRYLYDAVGRDYQWVGKKKLDDAELAALIHDPRVEIHVLHVDGSPAGFAEFDRRQLDEIEMVQFGLTRDFIGMGLGKWFLEWTIGKAWSYRPKRFWLHTCTLDHPAALPNYRKAGFEAYKQEIIRRENSGG